MVSKSKLYLFWLRFLSLAPFLLRGLTWVKLCAWMDHPKNVGTCPGLPPNLYLKIEDKLLVYLAKFSQQNFQAPRRAEKVKVLKLNLDSSDADFEH